MGGLGWDGVGTVDEPAGRKRGWLGCVVGPAGGGGADGRVGAGGYSSLFSVRCVDLPLCGAWTCSVSVRCVGMHVLRRIRRTRGACWHAGRLLLLRPGGPPSFPATITERYLFPEIYHSV
ncbi:hypothetical protein JCM4914_47160 [Streptomyces platensis subsp. malvinus]